MLYNMIENFVRMTKNVYCFLLFYVMIKIAIGGMIFETKDAQFLESCYVWTERKPKHISGIYRTALFGSLRSDYADF